MGNKITCLDCRILFMSKQEKQARTLKILDVKVKAADMDLKSKRDVLASMKIEMFKPQMRKEKLKKVEAVVRQERLVEAAESQSKMLNRAMMNVQQVVDVSRPDNVELLKLTGRLGLGSPDKVVKTIEDMGDRFNDINEFVTATDTALADVNKDQLEDVDFDEEKELKRMEQEELDLKFEVDMPVVPQRHVMSDNEDENGCEISYVRTKHSRIAILDDPTAGDG